MNHIRSNYCSRSCNFAVRIRTKGNAIMPKIDLASIPGLDTAQALFGAATTQRATYDDRIIEVMVYIYDTIPPEQSGFM